MGYCGYEAEHKDWPVAAYLNLDKAREHARLANTKSLELKWPGNCVTGALGVLDSTGEVMTDEPNYTYWELEILDEIPT